MAIERRVKTAAVIAAVFVVGLALGWVLTRPGGAAHEVKFAIGGNGQIVYAATSTPDGEPFRPVSAPSVSVPRGGVAVMTVVAAPGGTVSCQLLVDGVVTVSHDATDGGSATCAWVN